jgi:hypothetical protein
MLLVKIKEKEVSDRVKFKKPSFMRRWPAASREVKAFVPDPFLWLRVERPGGKHDRFLGRYFPSIGSEVLQPRAPADREALVVQESHVA